jgi:hypothetical protein
MHSYLLRLYGGDSMGNLLSSRTFTEGNIVSGFSMGYLGRGEAVKETDETPSCDAL